MSQRTQMRRPLRLIVAIALIAVGRTRHALAFSMPSQNAATDRRSFCAWALVACPTSASALNKETKDTMLFLKDTSTDVAKERFRLARSDLAYLVEHYAEISASGGGDAVRNYLGTQGITSGMYGIQKVLKRLQGEADDIVEYTETMDEFNAYLYQAEGAAYQSMFAQHSSSRSTPESLLATAKQDVLQMVKYMDRMAEQLSI
eukprot:CAMPEP_0198118176 /NCGR_PEP_ID=MMETSP1442-20131203/20648_1 /TAXON_ID= /ORGANISM="Craspedostauros australis, Strain CCMP3328" /LENGTH=202 /DNA_ID=CAMNT_0043776393 /DNA_START=57 /DNA_END=665 /DNA_ORIENTATION=-